MNTVSPSAVSPPNRWRRLVPAGILLAGLVAFFAMGWHRYFTFDYLHSHRMALTDWVAANAALAALAYIALYTAVTALSLPAAAIVTLAGGFLFGIVLGTLWTVIGATLGAVIVFLAARSAFGALLRNKAGSRLARLEAGFKRDAFSYLMFLRLVPVFPFWLVNLAAAFLGVDLRVYTIATLIGIIPGTAVFAAVGAGLGTVLEKGDKPDLSIIFSAPILLPILALAALSLVPILYRRYKERSGGGAS